MDSRPSRPAAPLEHEHEDPERGAEGEGVHHERLERQEHRPGEEEDQDGCRQRKHSERPRQVAAEACLLIDERRRRACHSGGGKQAANVSHDLLRRRREPFGAWHDIQPPETWSNLAGG